MTRFGRRCALSAALAATALSGCSLPGRGAALDDAPAPAAPPAESRHQFAELIRAPGERVALNASVVTVEARTEPLAVPRPAPAPPAVTIALPPPNPPAPPPDPPLVAAVRHALDGRTDLAAEAVRHLEPANREAVLQILPALAHAGRDPLGPRHPRASGELGDRLQATADRLHQFAPIRIDKALFCRDVKSYGRYDPRPEGAAFAPGGVAELYVEVGNAPSVPASRPGDGDGFLTPLACRFQVRDRAGKVVPLTDRNRQSVEAIAETRHDFTRSPVRDYFLRFLFPVPTAPGSYTVAVEVRDPATGRSASRAVPLRVE